MTSNQTIKHYPLSSPQLDFWFDQILHPDVPLYNIGGYVRIEGPIDPSLFEKALNQVIQENDALRIILHAGESLPTQTFAENVCIKRDFHDFSEKENAHESALKWMQQEFVKPFQLYDGLLFQFPLCKVSNNCYYWLMKYHHLIVDGWAISLIVQRVAAAYNALVTGQTREPQYYSYQDFIQNDQAYLESEKFVKAKHYWQEKYREVPEPLMVRRYAAQFQGKTIPSQRATLRLNRPFYNQLIDFASKNKVSTFHVILGALYCYFVRTCHREDLSIGLFTLNRNSAAFKKTSGMFTKANPAWFRFGTDLSFVELMEKIRKELQRDYRYQRLPYREINRQVGQHSHQPLFNLTLSYGKHDFDTYFNGKPARAIYFTKNFEQNALALFIDEFHQQDDVNIYFDYNLGFFDGDEIERLKARFEFLLGEILRKPSVPVRELQIMPDAELNQIWVEWNNTATDYPREKTIVELFEKQVAKTPTAIAVVFENQSVTYQELNLKANQLAHHLQTLSVKPDELVGLCVEASLEMIVGLLGILKAGGAYVPLDPNYPPERLAFMLSNAQAKVLLTQQKWLEQLPQLEQPIFCLDSDWAKISKPDSANLTRIAQPDNLIYVIYTSGSTGKPKGAGIYHRGFTNLVNWFVTDFTLTAADSVLVISSFSFDLTQKNFFAPLIVGGQLHLLLQGHYDPKSILQTVHEQKITWLNCTPSAFYPLCEPSENSTFQKLTSLRYVFLGGEPISLTKLLPWLQSTACQAKVVNTYGPTECSDVCALYLLPKPEPFLEPAIPIGKPISNAKLFILGKHLDRLPIGVAGELHIGGVGLGCGYLNRPDLTAEKFINNPFDDDPNSRLYKTGDLARYLPDGNIEYLGRIDNQVKIRGFRIELSEIEAVLATHPFVKENAVIVHEASEMDKRLVAYIVSHQGQVIENMALRIFLTERLPDYMIPSAFVTLDTLPLTPNGKIDRRALSQLSVSHDISEKTFVAPRTPDEKSLADIWAEVLGGEQVGIHDSFFELGGHSLLATQVISRLRDSFGVELSLRELFESPTIAELVQRVETNRERELNDQLVQTIQPISRQQKLPLSYFQEQLWFLVQVNPGIPFYNESTAIHINNRLNVAALSQSFSEIIKRHEILRTTFVIKDGQPVQNVIALPPTFKLPIVDLRTVPHEQAEALLLANEQAKRPFDLTEGPLVRAILVQIDEAQFRLFVTAHHIVADGFCLYNIFMQELVILYKAFSTGESLSLPELPIQYADFAHWQWQQTFEEQLSYWKTVLGNNPPMLQLPTDHPRPVKPTFRGAKQNLTLSQSLTTKLKQLNQQEGVTLFMTLLTTFKTLLYRYTGQDDMVIGTFADCHNRSELENVMGHFVNTLVLRTDMSGNPTFKQLLARVREVTLGAYSHHDLPFQKLVEVLNPVRNANQNPFFEVALTVEPPAMSALDSDLNWTLYQYDDGIDTDTARFDLSFGFEERTNEIIGRIEYSTELFDAVTIERMIGHFQTLLEGIVTNPQQRISELPLLTERERHQLVEWNDTQADYPKDKCIHQLFEAQVETTPEAVAVVFEDQQLTYRELNTKANQLAHYLQTLGVKPEVLVGICVERSIEMVIGLLGILKVGGAYLPLDPAYPKARLAFMLEDAQVLVLLTQSSLKKKLPETKAQVVCLDVEAETLSRLSYENLISGVTPTNLAYVIYTSGSTGNPKGVQIGHSSLLNFLTSMQKQPGLTEADVLLAITTISFDIAALEIYLPLIVGAKIVLARRFDVNDGEKLLEKLNHDGITIMQATPATWHSLVMAGWKTRLKLKILCGGEALPRELAIQLLEKGQTLWNLYGPTETTIWSLMFQVTDATAPISIGQPIANTQVYILDRYLQPVPIGVQGELHIGGAGLARGYLNRPDLTGEKFIKNPFSDNQNSRIYKTGDLARYLPDGNIEYLGRIDNQVKIRGFRIELGEIEAVLAQHPLVTENAVIVHEASKTDKRLVAYLVPHQGQVIENTALRDFLKERLPDYMIPSAFVTLENLPLTPNGKIDRRALSQLSVSNYPLSEKTFVAPRTSDEELLAGIWGSVLNVERVGVHDNFFELGGHSLLAVSLLAQIEQQFGKQLPLAALFQGATIAELALQLNSTDTTNSWAPLVAIQPHGTKRPFFCLPGAGGNVLYYYQLAHHMGIDQPFYGLQAVGLDGETAPETRVEDMAIHYLQEIQTIQPQGPYLLGGHSFGAWVALEISKQLQLKGEKVARLAIFDTTVPFNQPIGIDWDEAQWITDVAHIIGSLLDRELEVSYAEFQQLETQAQFSYLHEILKQNGWLISIKQLQALVKIFKANCQTNYVPQAIPATPLSLFKARDIPLVSQASTQMESFSQHLKQEASWGWGQYAEGLVDIHVVPGDHHTMMSQPNVQVLAEKLRACLDKVQSA